MPVDELRRFIETWDREETLAMAERTARP